MIDNRGRIQETLVSLNATVQDLRGVLARTTPAAERTLATAEGAAGDARIAIASADVTIRRADTLVQRLDSLVYDVRHGGGTASMVLYDTAFANDLRRTIDATRAFIEQSKRHGVNLNISLGRKP